MIILVYHQDFLSSIKKLPLSQKRKLTKLLEIVSSNPFHSLLHTKRLSGELTGILSFRISRDWRVLFRFLDHETIQLLIAAHRKDIYR
ncbi:MAG: hypothetical protein V1664_05100 [Candidatus Uhrbacteria bacterium]